MSFSHDDVQRLIKLLDSSHFDELHLEAEGIKLTLRRNGASSAAPAAPSTALAPAMATSPAAALPTRAAAAAPAATATPTNDPTLIEIRAPMLGTFYGAPKPGADPFIAIGARVSTDSAVGIIEVMKLMNSITAGVRGIVTHLLVDDATAVETGQPLILLRPDPERSE